MVINKKDLESLFLNGEKFYRLVNDNVSTGGLTYMEAIMSVCDERGIDPEDLVKLKLISPILKSKLEEESVQLGLLKETSRLPI